MNQKTSKLLRRAAFSSAPNAPYAINRSRYQTLKSNYNRTPGPSRHALKLALVEGARLAGQAATSSENHTESS